MKPTYHVIVSTGVSLGVQATAHSWPATAACFFSGILIDVDHYLEYVVHRRAFPFRYKDLVDFCTPYREAKVYMIFHAYEYLIVLWSLIYFCHLGAVWIGLTLGLTVHLILDQFTNPIKPLFYFLTYRFKNQFLSSKLLAAPGLT